MKKFLLVFFVFISIHSLAQEEPDEKQDTSWKKIYRETPALINDLVHTKLDVKFDYDKAYLYGKAWITLKPHFYPTDSLTLDAKGMDINLIKSIKEAIIILFI
jgi:aminopeptidase N